MCKKNIPTLRKNTSRINKIDVISFLLACMVVWLHSAPKGDISILFKLTSITNSFCSCAVPTFFFISGFLFFLDYRSEKVKEKLIIRIRTLVIPYVIWNILASLCWCLVACMANDEYVEEISRYNTFSEYLYLFLFSGHLSVFWFIRNLIVYQFLSPCIYYMLNNKASGVFLVLIFIVTSIFIPMSYTSLLYWLPMYMFGCWIGLHKKEWIVNSSLSNKYKVLALLVWILCFITAIVTRNHLLFTLFRLISPIGLIITYDLVCSRFFNKTGKYIKYSFGIYAMHWIPLYLIQTYHSRHIISVVDNYIVFYLLPIILILLSILICYTLESLTPHFYSLLTGGRGLSKDRLSTSVRVVKKNETMKF